MENGKKPFSILFVEDEEIIRQNYALYLSGFFETIYEAEDGVKAYEVYKEKKPDIMIVDINMPNMNGIELVQKIREHDHHTKVIMLTANSDVEYLLRAAELKLTKYLVKPITRDELDEALELALEEMSSFEVIAKDTLTFSDGYSWDISKAELTQNAQQVNLTKKEHLVLEYLITNINNVCSYDDIIYHAWYDDVEYKIESLKTVVKTLRRKLPKEMIKNVFGVGYKVSV